MTFEELFAKVKNQIKDADVSNIGGKLAFEFNITGEGEGIFYAEVKDGKLSVEPYNYNDKDVKFTVSADNFIKIIQGKLDPVAAFTLGKLKIDGDIQKALMLKEIIK